jgi:predicted metal-binding membrane protein
MSTLERGRMARRDPLLVGTVVVAVALVTWIVTVERMRGMDGGPGTDLGAFGWFLGVWVTMMAAMMLPSAAPMVLLFQRISSQRARSERGYVPVWIFAASYLAVWAAYGLVAYGLYRLVIHVASNFLAWDRAGPYVAGGAIALAGLYELTPLKSVCLHHCRSPLHFVLGRWRDGRFGAIRMGAEHGAYCVGCCWGLMIVLFALGVMSLLWMVVVAALIFAQKVLPGGDRLTRLFAAAFIAAGIWVAAAPASVPWLTQPGSGSMQPQMQKMRTPGMKQP